MLALRANSLVPHADFVLIHRLNRACRNASRRFPFRRTVAARRLDRHTLRRHLTSDGSARRSFTGRFHFSNGITRGMRPPRQQNRRRFAGRILFKHPLASGHSSPSLKALTNLSKQTLHTLCSNQRPWHAKPCTDALPAHAANTQRTAGNLTSQHGASAAPLPSNRDMPARTAIPA